MDPPDPRDPVVAKRLREYGVAVDENGYPISPRGDTGVQFGRGDSNQWGPNQAGDGHITRVRPDGGMLEILVGRRSDNKRYATPGGMFDSKLDRVVADTIGREIREETGLDLDFTAAPVSYADLAIDDRDANQAYFVTECRRIHLPPELSDVQPQASDDLTTAEFVVITPELLDEMHAIHGQLVEFSVRDLVAEQPNLAANLHPALGVRLGLTSGTQRTSATATAEIALTARPATAENPAATSDRSSTRSGRSPAARRAGSPEPTIIARGTPSSTR